MATRAERSRYESERAHPPTKTPPAADESTKRPAHAVSKKAERARKDAPLIGRAELVESSPSNRYRESGAGIRRPRASR